MLVGSVEGDEKGIDDGYELTDTVGIALILYVGIFEVLEVGRLVRLLSPGISDGTIDSTEM